MNRFSGKSAALLICSFIISLFASCTSGNDNPVTPVTPDSNMTEADVFAKKLVGVQLDFTNFFFEEEILNIWEMNEDRTFVIYSMYEEDGETKMDELKGTWEPFVNASAEEWGADPSQTLNGFKAVFDTDDETIAREDRTMVYYVEEDSVDGKPYMVLINEVVLDYMYILQFNDQASAGTRGILDIINTIVDGVKSFVSHPFRWIINTVGLDLGHNLNEEDCRKYYEEAQKALNNVQQEFNTNTNYSEWMSEIYTKNGKDPRICEMNIPGTHDAATGYMSMSFVESYARTQLLDFKGQWDAGIRCFDIRIKNMKGNLTALINILEDKLGLFHGPIWTGKTAEEGFAEIISQLKEHPGETAVIMLDFEGLDGKNIADRKLAYDFVQQLKTTGCVAENLRPDMKLSEVAGKMMIFQGWDYGNKDQNYRVGPIINNGYNQFTTGKIGYWDGQPNVEVPIFYQNLCETTMESLVSEFWAQKKELMTKCFQATQRTKGDSSNSWAMNQASAFVGGKIHMSYSKNANVMNTWTMKYVLEHKSDKMNIISMDFAGTNDKFDGYYTNGHALPRMIVETNRFQ